jgi:hypothetical protein
MKSVESEVERVKRRIAVKDQKLHTVLDTLESELDALITELETSDAETGKMERNIEAKGTFEPSSQPSGSEKTKTTKLIRSKCDRIVGLKSIAAIKTLHKEYFTFVSKLGKTLDKSVTAVPVEIEFDFQGVQRDLHSLVDDHHREHLKTLNPESPQAKTLVIYEHLERILSEKDVVEALTSFEMHQETLKLIDSEFKMHLCKAVFLKIVREAKMGEAILFLRSKFPKPSAQQAEEIGELIHSVCYPKDAIPPKRLTMNHDFEGLITKCLKQVRRAVRRLKGLPEISTFLQLVSAGLVALPQYLAHKEIWSEMVDEQEIHVSIHLPKEMIHHSMIYCPITKDVCDPKVNVPLLQTCGHIVGQSSVRKMVDANRGRNFVTTVQFKCPTCPNQQTQVSMKPVLY